MSSDFKLNIATDHDYEEPGLGNTIGSNISLDEKGKAVHTTFNGIRDQGNFSPKNYATNAERRALYDRCETYLLFHSFCSEISCVFSLNYTSLVSLTFCY